MVKPENQKDVINGIISKCSLYYFSLDVFTTKMDVGLMEAKTFVDPFWRQKRKPNFVMLKIPVADVATDWYVMKEVRIPREFVTRLHNELHKFARDEKAKKSDKRGKK